MKECSKCKNIKDFTAYYKCSKSKNGFQSQCKDCKSIGLAEYYKNNPHKSYNPVTGKLNSRKQYYKNRISQNFSRMMRKSLNKSKDGHHWEILVDYTLADLKKHLESKFYGIISWENYGTVWHIDHIRPISSFNITSIYCDDFKKCWALTNLQPLTKEDNLSKSDKWIEDII